MPKLGEADATAFVQWFRAAAPYIHAFRGKTFVIAFGGDALADGGFSSLIQDFNLLNSLGVRLVLVHGVRPQVEERLQAAGGEALFVGDRRVTDAYTLELVKDAVGSVRVDIEAMLSVGLPNTPMAGAEIRVASGNFVTARPVGVIDGTDLQFTGEVRKVAAEAISARLAAGEIVLLSPLGYSPTGEVFNLTLEEVATTASAALAADKLIFLLDRGDCLDGKGQPLNQLTVASAARVIKNLPDGDLKLYLPHAVHACRQGVRRAHLLPRNQDGALLMELFTHDGVGTMLTREALENVRPARIEDVGGILTILEPLEQEGVLVRRSRERLEQEIEQFFVDEIDGRIVGCVALYPFADTGAGEMACLAVAPDFRQAGRGDALLGKVELAARELRLRQLFVLTTRTEHWFVERGFKQVTPDDLPAPRKALYNWQRRSKVLMKKL
jgi:amino-acid N-acetyltransferase